MCYMRVVWCKNLVTMGMMMQKLNKRVLGAVKRRREIWRLDFDDDMMIWGIIESEKIGCWDLFERIVFYGRTMEDLARIVNLCKKKNSSRVVAQDCVFFVAYTDEVVLIKLGMLEILIN